MVFSSVPSYLQLDPPNWQQNHHNSQLPPPAPLSGGGGAGGGIRTGSMTERAGVAKIPHPDSALKCPRCESTNTKFCYFNNYNLSQPRHFCKTCRRYWTRGGALRNVPVGGGCRRNKRSKGRKRSKSPSVISERQTAGSNSSVTPLTSNGCTNNNMLSHMNLLLASLHLLGDYNSGDIGLNFGAIQAQLTDTGDQTNGTNMDFQIGMSSNGVGSMLTDWRSMQQVQQFPFLTSSGHPQTGLYSFENETMETLSYQQPLDSTITESSAVKMEETPCLNPSRNFLGISGNDQYWLGGHGGNPNPGTNLSGFTSSSKTHFF